MITVSKAFDKSIKTPNKSVMSRMTIPKTKLFVKNKKSRKLIDSSPFLSDLKIGVTFAIFIFSGEMPRFIDSMKIFSSVFYEFIHRCDNIYI